ncbi:hypothetical protein JOB18_024729 [Solea senegalensis]|uniref:Uncharacterized protein n=1 Tax=Solea senegalensis TaxID=28829 RepID=A0AAV6QWR6_SOLSE|nr:hypothetical protein JOB18_024729 [Solea senegalensis]
MRTATSHLACPFLTFFFDARRKYIPAIFPHFAPEKPTSLDSIHSCDGPQRQVLSLRDEICTCTFCTRRRKQTRHTLKSKVSGVQINGYREDAPLDSVGNKRGCPLFGSLLEMLPCSTSSNFLKRRSRRRNGIRQAFCERLNTTIDANFEQNEPNGWTFKKLK